MDVSQNEEIQTETKNVEKLETISEEESEPKSKTENTKAKKRAKKPRTKKQVEAFQKMIKKRKENLESKKKAKETKADDGEKPSTATDNIPPKVEEKPKKKPKPKPEPKPEPKTEPKSDDGVAPPSATDKLKGVRGALLPDAKPQIEETLITSAYESSDTESDTDSDDGVSPPSATNKLKGVRGALLPDDDGVSPKRQPKKSHNSLMKVFTHDNVRRQVNRPNMSNREYQSGYSRETIEKAKQELKRNRSTSRNKMTQRNNIANRRFDSSIFK